MTPRPPLSPHDALSAEEREIAAHLAKLDAAAGPSAALDARVLAMARGAAATRPSSVRRWPRALGAAAVLVAAVGLAWQLKPMFSLGPPPITSEDAGAGRSGVESDVVVAVESVPRRAPDPVAETGDAAAQAVPSASWRRGAPAAGGSTARSDATNAKQSRAVPPRVEEPAQEALSAPQAAAVAAPPAVAQDAAAPAAPPPPDAERIAPQPGSVRESGARVGNSAADVDAPDIAADTRLGPRAWLARIRDRRDNGDLVGARASLERFVARHPRIEVPRDLRPLLPDRDPWSP